MVHLFPLEECSQSKHSLTREHCSISELSESLPLFDEVVFRLIVFDAARVKLKYLVRVKNLPKPVEPQL